MMSNSLLVNNIEFTSTPSHYTSQTDVSDPNLDSVKEEETELILCLNSFVSFKNFLKNVRKRPKKVVELVLSSEKLLNNVTTNYVLNSTSLDQPGYMGNQQEVYQDELTVLSQVLKTNNFFKTFFTSGSNTTGNSNMNSNTGSNNNLFRLLNAYKVRSVANKNTTSTSTTNKLKPFNNNIVKSELEVIVRLEVESYFKTVSYLCNYSLENSNVLLNNLIKNNLFSFLNSLFFKYIVVSKFVANNTGGLLNTTGTSNPHEENEYCTKLLSLILEGIISLHYVSNLYDKNQLNLYYNTFTEQNLNGNLHNKYDYSDRLLLMQDLLLSLYVLVNKDYVDLKSNYLLYTLLTKISNTTGNSNMNSNTNGYNTYEVLDYVNSILLLNNNYRYNSVKILLHNILFKTSSVNAEMSNHSLVKYLKYRNVDQNEGDWYINVYLARNNLFGKVLFDQNMDNLLLPLYLLNNYLLTVSGSTHSSLTSTTTQSNTTGNTTNNYYHNNTSMSNKEKESEVYNYVLSVLFSNVDPRRFGLLYNLDKELEKERRDNNTSNTGSTSNMNSNTNKNENRNTTLFRLLLRYVVQYCEMAKRGYVEKSNEQKHTLYNTLLLFNRMFKLNYDFYVLMFLQLNSVLPPTNSSSVGTNTSNTDSLLNTAGNTSTTKLLLELHDTLYKQGNFKCLVLVLEFFYYYFTPDTYFRMNIENKSRTTLELESRVNKEVKKDRLNVLNTLLNDFNLTSNMLNDVSLFNRYTKFYVLLYQHLVDSTSNSTSSFNQTNNMNNTSGTGSLLNTTGNTLTNNNRDELFNKMKNGLYHYFKFLVYEFNNFVLNNSEVDLLATFYNNMYSVLNLAFLLDKKQKLMQHESEQQNASSNSFDNRSTSNLLPEQRSNNKMDSSTNNNLTAQRSNMEAHQNTSSKLKQNENKSKMLLKLVKFFINNTNNIFSNLFNILLCNTLVNNNECYVYNKFNKLVNPEHLFLLEQQEFNTDEKNVVTVALNLVELILKIISKDKNLLFLFFQVFVCSYNSSLYFSSSLFAASATTNATTNNTSNTGSLLNTTGNMNSNINLNNLLYSNPNNANNLKVYTLNKNVSSKYLHYLNENDHYLNLLESLKTLSTDYSKCVDVLLLLFNLYDRYNKLVVTNNVLSNLKNNYTSNTTSTFSTGLGNTGNTFTNSFNSVNGLNNNTGNTGGLLNTTGNTSKLSRMENTLVVRKEDLLEHLLVLLNNLHLNQQDTNWNKSDKEVVNLYKLITNVVLNNYYNYYYYNNNNLSSSNFNANSNKFNNNLSTEELNNYRQQKNKNNFLLLYNDLRYDSVVSNYVELNVVNFLNSSTSNNLAVQRSNMEPQQNNSSNCFDNRSTSNLLLEQLEKERKLNLKILYEVLKLSDFKFLVKLLNKFINNISSRKEQEEKGMQQELELYLKNLNILVEKLLVHYYFLKYNKEQQKSEQHNSSSNSFDNRSTSNLLLEQRSSNNLLNTQQQMHKKLQRLLVVGDDNNVCEVVEKLLLCYFLLYTPTSNLRMDGHSSNTSGLLATTANDNFNLHTPNSSSILLDNVKYAGNMYSLLKLLNEQNVYVELADTTKFLSLSYLQLLLYNLNNTDSLLNTTVSSSNELLYNTNNKGLLQNYLNSLYKLFNLLTSTDNNNTSNNRGNKDNKFNFNQLLHNLILLLLNNTNSCNESDPNKLLLMCNLFSNLNDYESNEKSELYNKITEQLTNYYNTTSNAGSLLNTTGNSNSHEEDSSNTYNTYEVLDYELDFVTRFKDDNLSNTFSKNMLDKRVKAFKCLYLLNTNYKNPSSCNLFKDNNTLDNVVNVLKNYNGQYKLRYHKYLKYLFKLVGLLMDRNSSSTGLASTTTQSNTSKLSRMENTVALKLLNAFKWDENGVYKKFEMLLVDDDEVKLNYKYELYLDYLNMFTNSERNNFNLEFNENNRKNLDSNTDKESLEHLVDVVLNTFYYRAKVLFEQFNDGTTTNLSNSSNTGSLLNTTGNNNMNSNSNIYYNYNNTSTTSNELLYNNGTNNLELRMVEMRYCLEEVLLYVKMLNMSSSSCNNNKLKLLNHLRSLVFNLMAVTSNLSNNTLYNYKFNNKLVVYNIFNNYVNLINKFKLDLNLLGFMNYVKLFSLSSLQTPSQHLSHSNSTGSLLNTTGNSNNYYHNTSMSNKEKENRMEYTYHLESRVRNTLLEKLLVLYVYNSSKMEGNELERKENNKEVLEIYKELADYGLVEAGSGSFLHLLQLLNT